MRLINADRIVYSWTVDNDGERHDGITLQSIIDKMPTVDAEPVRHGRWIVEEWINTIFCSECGNSWNIMDNDTETFVYCPNCGAKMDERREDAKTN